MGHLLTSSESIENGMRSKDTLTQTTCDLHFIMTFEIAAALLNRASNGEELLQILESIAADNEAGSDA